LDFSRSKKIFDAPASIRQTAAFYKQDAMLRSQKPTFRDLEIMKNTSLFTAAVLSILVAGAVHAQPVMRDGALVDASGRTVYTFDKDEAGKSNCSGGCSAVWPAFTAKAEATAKGEFGIIEANGARQWTVNGKPLYYFAGDAKPGERNGDGKGGTWHLVVASKPVAQVAPKRVEYGSAY